MALKTKPTEETAEAVTEPAAESTINEASMPPVVENDEAAAAAESKKKNATVKPEGPFETRSGAKALVVGGRPFTSGGEKGQAIANLLTTTNMSRKDIAATVGSSQSRVAEVAKVLGLQKKNVAPPAPDDVSKAVAADAPNGNVAPAATTELKPGDPPPA